MPAGRLKRVLKASGLEVKDGMLLISHCAGDSFFTGDVLLEIETDKAQMDVEAQDDGKMAKIIVRQS